mmetsp:Transcript_33131/g.43630  ORF Transcript_33131/g.43630 Transcript_33131/m.43630 type:complete len:403 (+) Transcript_33131:143-1351(+)|eukprot:CAMPEP_0117757800 /NCGR_PEP_ID=MMETSP0947-20121206/14962_1 /TAXON_ID=44440 /ORGANISM="Chattonella subsalsa, Strain CCMP2191" /LENGTH=402 /DNA_ID=CAMNT_0005577793 /DNA_START=118 /DNA_END=1326 /DNA_ORIENTATION=-
MFKTKTIIAVLSLLAESSAKLSQIHFIDNAEREPLVHYSSEHAKPGPLFPSQITESIARIMGVSSPVGSSFSNLPAGDLFNGPHVNIVLNVEGTSGLEMADTLSAGGPAYSFTINRMSKSNSNQPLVLEAMGEGLESPLTHSEGMSSICASGSDWFLDSKVCEKAKKIDAESTTSICSEALPEKFHTAAARSGYAVLPAKKEGKCPVHTVAGPAGEVTFDMEDQVDAQFFEEMALLAQLPELLSKDFDETQSSPALHVVTISSLEPVLRENEETSPKAQAAAALADSSVAQMLEAMYQKYPGKVVGQVIRTPEANAAQKSYGFDPWQKPHRYLAAVNATNSSSNATYYTLEEIRDYQIALWTAVMLILAVFTAIMMTACMNIEPDSILFAKFQADTTGLKAD